MTRRALLLASVLGATACDPGCEAAEGLEPGAMAGTIDDLDWAAAGATWFGAETGVQVNSVPGTDGWRVTFVAQTTNTGHDAATKTKRGGLPVDVTLKSGAEGGWALVNQGDADTFTTADEDASGGTLRLSRKGGGDLFGCGVFVASDGRNELTADVAFRADAADVGSTQ